ncbi:MAG: FAD-dependent oxidoreductase [Eubacteriaceae bacterium]|nr:FAD-dependent oxidoreductase [Eubacteriaceae bacterium]MDD4508215.1 FAD-dependent oxidoreductase [Eubacteriaceae bacterium]
MSDTNYLIIGNSAAGIGGIQGIREVDPDGTITLVASEPYHTYSRPLISYWLEGRVDQEQMKYRDDDFYEKNGVTTRLGTTVTGIDEGTHMVTLDNGETVSYDKLLLATGSSPFVPPIEGKETAQNAFTFTTMEDAQGVKACLTPESRVVILGAGLIGLKAAEALVDQCAGITIVDLADRVLPSVLDEECATVMENYLTGLGMSFKLKTSITKIGNAEVTLSDGDKLPYDILILAVGTRPATGLAQDAGAECERGIVTDDTQKTNLMDIYAAGDCTQSHDISSGTEKNMAILPNAFMQGETAGINMAGGEAHFDKGFPVNAMGIKDFYMLTAGSTVGEPIEITGPNHQIRKFYISDDELKGYMIMGDCQRGGIYTDLIRKRTHLSSTDWKKLLEAPQLSAFDQEERRAKLARVH